MHKGVFGEPVFSVPVFSAPTIPAWGAGQRGPNFGIRPSPPGFPRASVSGFGGRGRCPGGCGGLGTAVETVNMPKMAMAGRGPAQMYNASACARLGWSGNVSVQSVPPFLAWTPGRGEVLCDSVPLAAATREFQRAVGGGLVVDGKLGPRTLAALKGVPLPAPERAPGGEGDPAHVAMAALLPALPGAPPSAGTAPLGLPGWVIPAAAVAIGGGILWMLSRGAAKASGAPAGAPA